MAFLWWILQIFGILGVAFIHTFNRWAGIKGISFTIKWAVNSGAQICIAPLFIMSYALAPGFFQPWFLGTGLIALLGFLGSVLFFGEIITLIKLFGAALVISGAILLIL